MRGIGKKILCGMTCAVMAFVSLGSVNLVHAEESADTTGPVIDYDSLEVAEGGTTINVGDRVHIKVKVTDDQSGVERVYIRYWPKDFEWIIGQETFMTELAYNEQTGYWEGTSSSVSKETYNTQHYLLYVYASDKAGNSTDDDAGYLEQHKDKYTITTQGGVEREYNAPIITVSSVKVKKQNLKPGDERLVQASATDRESRISHMVMVYKTPDGDEYIEMSDYDGDGVYTELMREWSQTSGQITSETEKGLYQLLWVEAYDNQLNRTIVYNANVSVSDIKVSSYYELVEDNTYEKCEKADLSAADYYVSANGNIKPSDVYPKKTEDNVSTGTNTGASDKNPTPATETTKQIIISATGEANVSLSGTDAVLAKDNTLKVAKIDNKTTLNSVKSLISKTVSAFTGNYAVYEFDLLDAAGTSIHELNGNVQITMPIPENLKTSGKTLQVYRVDGDQLVKCQTTVNEGNISFITNHFSTYVIVEEDAQSLSSPKTGEFGMNYFLLMMFMVGAVAFGIVTYGVVREKKN